MKILFLAFSWFEQLIQQLRLWIKGEVNSFLFIMNGRVFIGTHFLWLLPWVSQAFDSLK